MFLELVELAIVTKSEKCLNNQRKLFFFFFLL